MGDAMDTAVMGAGSASTPAAARFFSSPELLSLLMTHLSLERADLVTLAAVSTTMRSHALEAWARHLDLRLSTAHRFLRIFKQNPTLAANVRFLRVRNDIAERVYAFGEGSGRANMAIKRSKPQWDAAHQILVMIAQAAIARPEVHLPRIDITLGLTDASHAQQIFVALPVLAHGLVALRIIADVDTRSPDEEEEDLHDHHADEDREPVDPESIPAIVSYIQAWQRNWEALSGILDLTAARDQIAHCPGLLHFQFYHQGKTYHEQEPTETRWDPPAVPQRFWTALNAASPSLRHLALILAGKDNVDEIFLTLKHVGLKNFVLSAKDAQGFWSEVDEYLDRNKDIEDLSISAKPASIRLSLRQTFPRLRHFTLDFGSGCHSAICDEHYLAFAKRHPHLQSTHITGKKPASFFPDNVYPNLTSMMAFESAMNEHVERGGQLRRISPLPDDMLAAFTRIPFLSDPPEWTHTLTSVEIFFTFNNLASALPHFKTASMPNLVELGLRSMDSGLPPRGEKSEIRRTFSALSHYSSLRILRISLATSDQRLKRNMLVNFPAFPPSLQYFIYRGGELNITQCYRFLPYSESVDVIGDYDRDQRECLAPHYEFDDYHWPYENGDDEYDEYDIPVELEGKVKRGRLQEIPPTFRTQITRDGVWVRGFGMWSQDRVLDHYVFPPVLRTS